MINNGYKPGLTGKIMLLIAGLLFSGYVLAAGAADTDMQVDLTGHWTGIVSLVVFVLAYILVIGEESIHLRKSKPVMVAAGIIWILVAIAYSYAGNSQGLEQIYEHDLLNFAELFLFLLAAMTYINTMEERGLFNLLRVWMISQGYSLRIIFWLTGI